MAIIGYTNGDGSIPSNGRERGKQSLASDFDNPIVTPSMLRGTEKTAEVANSGMITPSSLGLAKSASSREEVKEIAGTELLEGSQYGPRSYKEAIAAKHGAENRFVAVATELEAAMEKKAVKIWALEEVDLLTDPENIKGVDPTLFSREDVHPLSALIALNFWFEEKWIAWEPETLWEMLKDQGVTTEIKRSVKDTIMAVRGAIRINDFYSNYQSFCIICNAFNHKVVDFHSFQPPTVAEMSNTVKILSVIRDDDEYQLEVRAFIKAMADYEGMLVLPSELNFVNVNDETLAEDVLPRALELEETPTKASDSSVIDGQAIKYLTCKMYCMNENAAFSDEVNSFLTIRS